MTSTMKLEDKESQNPLQELKGLLGAAWEVTREEGRFVCSRDGVVYHVSGVYIEPIYKSSILSIAFAARKAYGW